jgi:signal transduction histidine kinase
MMKPQPMMGDIQTYFDLGATRDEVYVDTNHLQQVFLNIILNAVDALMDQNVSDMIHHPKTLTIISLDTDPFIEIRFKDNGIGIPAEEIGHVFDPFYTTKDPGKGTGLGLSVCYRIIESYGGTIGIESREGDGTTVILKLPIYENGDEEKA